MAEVESRCMSPVDIDAEAGEVVACERGHPPQESERRAGRTLESTGMPAYRRPKGACEAIVATSSSGATGFRRWI